MPKGRVRRAAPIAGLTARSAVGRVGAALRRRLGNDEAVIAFHERNALRYTEALSGAKGLLMKAGQLASFIQPGDLVGQEHWAPYQTALAALRTSAEPMEPELARAVVEAELGVAPEVAFAAFDAQAFAAASIGQVHRARLHDGRAVAVKVQYPGATEAISADVANTELLTTMMRLAQSTLPRMPRVDARAMARELGERVREELDYRTERANLETFARVYAEVPEVHIPATHPDLCTERVLTMDLAEGMPWAEALTQPQALRNQWGEVINRFFFRSLYRHGLFHADPHPGNYLFHEDGTVTILDFGSVGRFDDHHLTGLVEIARATIGGDAEGLAAEFRRFGFVAADDRSTPEQLLALYRPTFEWALAPQPFRWTPAAVDRVFQAMNPYGEGGAVARRFTLPPEYLLSMRIYVGLYSVLAALEAEADWVTAYRELVDHYDEHGVAAAV